MGTAATSTSRPSSSPKVPIFDCTVFPIFDCTAISTLDYTIRGHCAPPMLDHGKESGTTGSFPDRPSSEHANRDDHGATG